jgi:hypothetical protein
LLECQDKILINAVLEVVEDVLEISQLEGLEFSSSWIDQRIKENEGSHEQKDIQ